MKLVKNTNEVNINGFIKPIVLYYVKISYYNMFDLTYIFYAIKSSFHTEDLIYWGFIYNLKYTNYLSWERVKMREYL